ncbi:MAG: acyclic terpene utilization AtuA family protein [Actinomycetota bacterium]
MSRPIRIGNCSGYLGDRQSAMAEMLAGEPLDVITGDYLAELTMGILWKLGQAGRPRYARSFVQQLEDNLTTLVARGTKLVANAGGLDPAGLAAEVQRIAQELGVKDLKIAYLTGDDLTDRFDALRQRYPFTNIHTGDRLPADAGAVTANAYLGGWGIAHALAEGADIVICPRVTDASLVVGPAAWWHGWDRHDWDALAGATAAGHAIECGAHVCGGNYAFLDEIDTDRGLPGFPIAEVAADGSSVITKQPGTGGVVSAGTVTAQILYEVEGPLYRGPDVISDFGSLRVEEVAEDRVLISGCTGLPPQGDLKISLNLAGGYRNSMTFRIPRPDVELKARWVEAQLTSVLGGAERFDELKFELVRCDSDNARTAEEAAASLRVTAKSTDQQRVDREFSNAVLELGLSSYAGFHTSSPPASARQFLKFWPCLLVADEVEQRVVFLDGGQTVVPWTPGEGAPREPEARTGAGSMPRADASSAVVPVELGQLCGARSGDKGGSANVGLWARSDAVFDWLLVSLTTERFVDLVPETAGLRIQRHVFANLKAVNFVVYGFLGDGASAHTTPDTQAKGLGEFLRSRTVEVPATLLASVTGAAIPIDQEVVA